MRQIFNTLVDTTPEPPCAKEKKALDKATGTLENKRNQLISDKVLVANNLASIKSRENEKNPIEDSGNKEQSNYQSLLSIRKFFQNEAGTGNKTENGVPSAECFTPSGGPGRYRNSARCLALIADLDINQRELDASKAKLNSYNLQINKIYEKINTLKNEGTILETNVTKTIKDIATQAELVDLLEEIYNACLEKSNFSKSFNLKSNPSCKEIKQKIKIVNQKIISIDRQSLDLKYGFDSLPILNINKKLSGEKIKISKELIVKLDKLNPIIFMSDSSFYAIYKKAKDDLASYQTEGKTFEAKFKSLKLKEKNIKDKKISLKDKFSKLIKKLKTC
jgi:Tfp pilus assembly protein PilO